MTWFTLIDTVTAAAIFPAALTILVSGLDDLALDFVCLSCRWRKHPKAPPIPPPESPALPRVAIFVACWRESEVIATMVEHNLAAIAYPSFDFFIGAYPNDDPTLSSVRELEARFGNVHLALCPHPGPTSKADCLNWIYQRMLLFEEHSPVRFQVVVIHDAEDVIHPQGVGAIAAYMGSYDMVQIPVLPLPTPIWKMTHGVYCDEFAEYQWKDMRVRALMGSFVPSNGVGTGYSRRMLELLSDAPHNRIFDAACLTEDYEIGLRLHRLGCRQLFVPLTRGPKGFLATRELFPDTRSKAIRQRTRWVIGIALQIWERHGWEGTFAQVYWFWRDRKGLIVSPLGLLTNVLFAFGVITWAHARWVGVRWGLPQGQTHTGILACTLFLSAFHAGVRMAAVASVYGWPFALGVPPRIVWANYINASASCRALWRYLQARLRHQPLAWAKTDHAYPSRGVLATHKRPLGEILLESGYLTPARLQSALASQPAGMRIGEHLVKIGVITEDELYAALSRQQSLPSGRLDPVGVSLRLARSLPRKVIQQWQVLPCRVQSGNLLLATAEIPTDELKRALGGLTGLRVRFQLVTPTNFKELAHALL